MRNIIYSVLGLFVLLLNCNKETRSVNEERSEPRSPEFRFYGVGFIENPLNTKGIVQKNKLWYPGTAIKIRFLNGSSQMRTDVVNFASEWLEHAGIDFEYVDSDEADVRIAFDQYQDRYMTWSYTGTDCKYITDQSKATMNFAYWDELSLEEKKGDVLRAFGQMLGLELEHRHINVIPTWNSSIESYWHDYYIGDIPWSTLRKYVFDPLDSKNTISTLDYDPESIMIWPFPMRGLVSYANGYTVPKEFNYTLSNNDKAFIAKIYPKKKEYSIMMYTTDAFRNGEMDSFISKVLMENPDIVLCNGVKKHDRIKISESLNMDVHFRYFEPVHNPDSGTNLLFIKKNSKVFRSHYAISLPPNYEPHRSAAQIFIVELKDIIICNASTNSADEYPFDHIDFFNESLNHFVGSSSKPVLMLTYFGAWYNPKGVTYGNVAAIRPEEVLNKYKEKWSIVVNHSFYGNSNWNYFAPNAWANFFIGFDKYRDVEVIRTDKFAMKPAPNQDGAIILANVKL